MKGLTEDLKKEIKHKNEMSTKSEKKKKNFKVRSKKKLIEEPSKNK